MPSINLRKLGTIEFQEAVLPERVKAETLAGIRNAPIFVSESLRPGAKKDYIVAHEVGHRLKTRIAEEVAQQNPELFRLRPINQGIIEYLESQGLSSDNFNPVHPEVAENRDWILKSAREHRPIPETLAGETVAEIFAGYATDKSNYPENVNQLLARATQEKPGISKPLENTAQFVDPANKPMLLWLLLGAGIFILMINRK